MLRRLLSALGLKKKEPDPVKPGSSQLNRLQRQSAVTAVNLDALKAKRRGQPPR